ncbi:MAG: hypothetical protein O7B27_03705 [Gammaproteobacteria bacterium]|nr:hypothetical protein [Gammaproteobacteria bacterium]
MLMQRARLASRRYPRRLRGTIWRWPRYYIAKGADINAATDNDITPLQLATFWGHDDMVKLLKEHGAKE